MSEDIRAHAQDAVACTCSQAGFPSSCYNCDAEASDIVNALRKLYSTHPICAQAANYIERKLRDMATPSEPLQCLRCGTVDAFGPAARSPAEGGNEDIVAKLRAGFFMREEAADELERLRAQVESVAASVIEFEYCNWEGRKSIRQARPISIRFGTSEWHPKPQWLMLAFDIDKQAEREFAMQDMAFNDDVLAPPTLKLTSTVRGSDGAA